MKEAIVRYGPSVEIIESPIPIPGPDEVVIKVVVSGSNPKDWKIATQWKRGEINSGDDIAGVVHAVGENVTEFHPGDRVAAFHDMGEPGGSFAEFAVSPSMSTFHLPKNISFEEASTIPLAGITAAVALFVDLCLPQPFTTAKTPTPFLIHGASSAVGAFAIKLATKSNIHPLICVAGKGAPFVETLIERSKGDTIIDYRQGEEAILSGVQRALPDGIPLMYALDCVSENGSTKNICKALSPYGAIAVVLGGVDFEGVPDTIRRCRVGSGTVHGAKVYDFVADNSDFGYAWFRMFSRGLKNGWLTGHPYEVVPGGLNGIEKGLTNLKEGKASAIKYVFRIAETDGVTALL